MSSADYPRERARDAGDPTQSMPPVTGWNRSATAERVDTRPAATTTRRAAGRVPRARLVVTRVDPWSVMKLGFLLSIALGIVLVIAVVVLWSVLNGMGVFSSVNDLVNQIVSTEGGKQFDILRYAGLSRVVGVSTILALVNVVLITALATLGAFLYNLAASLVGGLHVTLAEDV
ncbi:MAG: DUF3566 domain-containing protein [Actinomycetales bacterium]